MNRYNPKLDRLITHDGVYGCRSNGMHDFVMEEMELGARAALALDDPDQWWWEIHRDQVERDLRNGA